MTVELTQIPNDTLIKSLKETKTLRTLFKKNHFRQAHVLFLSLAKRQFMSELNVSNATLLHFLHIYLLLNTSVNSTVLEFFQKALFVGFSDWVKYKAQNSYATKITRH